MANDEDVARIRQGVGAWNAWRAQNPEHRADLRAANLGWTDLRAADLGWTDLREADLGWADLCGADLGGTVFANVDLSATKGLDTCTHYGPSVLDHLTLQRSGRLPLAFLRGCGLPDRLIDYLPSLLEEAVQYHQLLVEGRGVCEAPVR